jgi:hypothetical protein
VAVYPVRIVRTVLSSLLGVAVGDANRDVRFVHTGVRLS